MTLDEAIARLREVNEPVPRPARLPTIDEIEAAQQRLRMKLHDDFIQYLLEASDVTYGTIEPVTLADPQAHTHLFQVAKEAWSLGVPRDDLLPICCDNGDYYCMNERGEVVFWDHNGTSNERWPNLAAWIEQVWLASGAD